MGQRTAAEVEQLQHLVEAGRVAGPRRDDREDPLQVAGQEVAGEQVLAGPHPVAIALQGVDLPVVGEIAVWVRQWPAREGVGGESGVDQRQGAVEALVAQIREKGLDLGRRQHPLVDDGAGREGRQVDGAVLVFNPLAQDEGPPLEFQPGVPGRARPRRPGGRRAWHCGRCSPPATDRPALPASPARPGPRRRLASRSRPGRRPRRSGRWAGKRCLWRTRPPPGSAKPVTSR